MNIAPLRKPVSHYPDTTSRMRVHRSAPPYPGLDERLASCHQWGMKRLSQLLFGGVVICSLVLSAGCSSPSASSKPTVAVATKPAAPAPAPAPVEAPKANPVAAGEAKPGAFVWPANKQVTLFDGKTLTGWKLTEFAGAGAVKVEPDFKSGGPALVLEQGVMTGITWTNSVPLEGYEINLEAMRVSGGDFFCGLTFPVGKDPCSLIIGGWGGGVVGLSSIDSEDAAHNETTKYFRFETGKWYRVRLRVTPAAIQAWLDDEAIVNLPREGHTFSVRIEVEQSRPLGISTWSTSGAIRKLELSAYPR